MPLPKKIKKDIPLTESKILLERRKELVDKINKDGTYLPKSLLHADLDGGFLDFVKNELKTIVDGKVIPTIDILITTQNWAQFTETWDLQNLDNNVEPPFISIVRIPEVKYGTNPSTLYEQEKINIWKEKFTLAQQMTGGQAILLSQEWVYNNILEMSDDEIERERKRIAEDMQRQQQQQAGMAGGEEEPAADEVPPDDAAPADTPDADTETGDTAVTSDEEAQIDDVDQILQNLDNMADEEESDLEETLVKNKGGRPREGLKFGTDKHPLGRDPLGHKENKKTYKRTGLSLETKNFLEKLPHKGTSKYRQMIAEDLSDDKLEG